MIHKNKGILNYALLPQETVSNIQSNLHLSKFWADIFWRRRINHIQRPDPEIPHIIQKSPQSVLEIGTAYGRVLSKIATQLHDNGIKSKLTGIEICPFFESYLQEYKEDNPILSHADFIFDDFFTTNKLLPNSFDIIVFPMNTVSSLSIKQFTNLLTTIRKYLASDGYFIFSVYKVTPTTIPKFIQRAKQNSYFGEILLGSKDRILAEYYTTDVQTTDYGAKISTLIALTRMNFNYEITKRKLFNTVKEYVLQQHLRDQITTNRFNIFTEDTSSHSIVYVIAPE